MKEWKIINQQYNSVLFPYAYHVVAMGSVFAKTCGEEAAADNFVEMQADGEMSQGFHPSEWTNSGRYILQRLENPSYARLVLKNTDKYLAKFFKLGEQIVSRNLKADSNAKLASLLTAFKQGFIDLASWGVLISLVDHEHEFLTKKVRLLLTRKLARIRGEKIDVEELFQILATSSKKTYVTRERDKLLKLALQFEGKNKTKTATQVKKLLAEHRQKFCWLSYGAEGPEMTESDVVSSFKELLNEGPKKIFADIIKHQKNTEAQQRYWLKKLKLTAKELHLVWLAREFGFSKALRKDVEYHGNYAYHKLITEVARRFYFSAHQGRYLSVDELCEILNKKTKFDGNLVAKRIAHSIFAVEDKKINLVSGPQADFYQRHVKSESTVYLQNTLHGQCAYPGVVTAKVKVVLGHADYSKFYTHNILVTYATNPNMVPLMKIAKAIITDIGGVTCHAAIVSRELGVPCVIGTKHATKVLKDGDLLEVDAGRGIIRKIN